MNYKAVLLLPNDTAYFKQKKWSAVRAIYRPTFLKQWKEKLN